MIYVIRCNQFFKIGRASDFRSRLETHRTSSPYPLEVVLAQEVHCSPEAELFLHRHFADRRERGEWFRLTADDLRDLRRLVASRAWSWMLAPETAEHLEAGRLFSSHFGRHP